MEGKEELEEEDMETIGGRRGQGGATCKGRNGRKGGT
jgi:hypothetical protein